MIRLKVGVAVPGQGVAVIDLNEAHPSFDQSACNQGLPPMHGIAVGLSNVRGFAADVEGVHGFQLHAGRQLVSLDARLNGRVLLARGLVSTIQRRQERQLTLLILWR